MQLVLAPGREASTHAAKVLGQERFARISHRVGAIVETHSNDRGLAAIAVAAALLVFGMAAEGPLRPILIAFGVMAALGSIPLLIGQEAFRPRMPMVDTIRLASAIAAEGLCAGCAGQLDVGAVEADGCVVCASCGAAWCLDDRRCACCAYELKGLPHNAKCPECGWDPQCADATPPPLPSAASGATHRTPEEA